MAACTWASTGSSTSGAQAPDDSTSKLYHRLAREAWKSRVNGPSEGDPADRAGTLHGLIQQVNQAISSDANGPSPQPTPQHPVQASTPAQTLQPDPQVKAMPAEVNHPTPQTQPSAGVSETPAHGVRAVQSPLDLAEVLSRGGQAKEAALYYQKAAGQTTLTASQRAWALFQQANCLRFDQPEEARRVYQQVIMDYPQSPWATFAKAREVLANWYAQEEPLKLLEQSKVRTPQAAGQAKEVGR